ncbi:MAG: leucine-rich repeat domain-containing protein [Oscillospiraceae bacterium]|nr:leucine-rich repeat domain-containing protein [Oscillospiraceae bacterium]
MTMHHAFCPMCGAVITVDLSHDALICPVCGRPFLKAQAVFADPAPAPAPVPAAPSVTFSKKEFAATPLSDLDIEYGVLRRYKGKSSYVILPDSIKEIGSNAFLSARNLRSVVLPESITKIGAQAFSECRSLFKLQIPDTVTLIGKGAFSSCKALTEITIPNGVQTVAADTFWGCTALKSVQFPPTLLRIESHAFYGCTALMSAGVPAAAAVADDAFPVQTNVIRI